MIRITQVSAKSCSQVGGFERDKKTHIVDFIIHVGKSLTGKFQEVYLLDLKKVACTKHFFAVKDNAKYDLG